MQKENINQLTSSRSVGMQDINAILVKCHSKLDLESHPILLRNDEILNPVIYETPYKNTTGRGPAVKAAVQDGRKWDRDDKGRSKNVGQVLPDNKEHLVANNNCVEGPEQRLLRTSSLLNHSPLIRTSSTFPLEGEGAPSTWRERAECVSTGVRGKIDCGFTLIELLVVILIIGILAAIAVPQYQRAVLKSRAASAWPLVNEIYQAQQLYFLTHGEYADSFESLDIGIPGNNTENGALCSVFREMSSEKGVCRSDTEWVFMMTIHPNHSLIVGAAPIQDSYTGSGWLKSTFLPNIHCANRNDKRNYGEYCQKLGYKNLKQSDGYISYYFR